MRIDRSVFLVTGAGSGLGAATARALAAEGARVLIIDRDEAGAALAADIGPAARFARADVTVEADVARAVAAARDAFGAIHGLVNCAGVAPAEKILGRDEPARTRVLRSHRVDQSRRHLQLPASRRCRPWRATSPTTGGERGVVINTASAAAFDGQIGQAAYAASKGGVAAMTLPAARELARHGIRVVCIAPGVFETPMLAAMPEPVREALGKGIPFPPRLGRPDEFAALVRHIVVNTMLNGETIRLDGALRMAPK